MKKTIVAVSVSAILATIGIGSSWAQDPPPPLASQVEGQGLYKHFVPPGGPDIFPSDEEVGQFEFRISPDPKGKKAPQAVIHVNGRELRKCWGGPLHIRGDYDWYVNLGDIFETDDPKPPQLFLFFVTHPTYGEVVVTVFAHDNVLRHGYDRDNPQWSDWFGLFIDRDGDLNTLEDNIFSGMGIVSNGDVMDYRMP